MDNFIVFILGLFISVLGITNIKGNISTIHSYNRRKVKEEDIPKYGKVVYKVPAQNLGIFQFGCKVIEALGKIFHVVVTAKRNAHRIISVGQP